MIQLFRQSNPFNIALLFLYTLVLHLYLFIKPFDPVAMHIVSPLGYFLFQWIWSLPVLTTVVLAVLTILVSYTNALVFNYTLNYYKLMPQFSFLPAFIFITMSACVPYLDLFSPQVIACFFLLWANYRLLGTYKVSHKAGTFFDMGLMMSIAILFVPAYWTLVFFIFLSLLLLRPFVFREWGAVILGLLIPILLCATLFFVLDQFPRFLALLEPQLQDFQNYRLLHIPPKHLLPAVFILITVLASVSSMQRYLPKMVVQLRNYYGVYLRLFLFILIMNGIHSSNGLQHFMLLAVPLSIPVSYVFARRRNMFWIETWWWLVIIIVLLMPFIR